MASFTKKTKKTDPSYKKNKSTAIDTELRFRLGRPASQQALSLFKIDIPHIMSMTNHRLYRQCGVYHAKIDLETSSLNADGFQVVTLSNTWMVKRAIQTARDMHDVALEHERAASGQSRWYDFRIYEGSAINAGQADMLPVLGVTPQSLAVKPYVGEWVNSAINDAVGNARQFVLSGASSSAQYNIFEEYDKLGNASVEPQHVGTIGGYNDITAGLDSADTNRLLANGNEPPYSTTDLPDEVFSSRGKLFRQSNLSGVSRESTGFFEAPLGLVWLVADQETTSAPPVSITIRGGNYKGVRMDAY